MVGVETGVGVILPMFRRRLWEIQFGMSISKKKHSSTMCFPPPRALVPRALMPSCPHPSFICLRIFGGIKKRINNDKGVIGDIGERVFGDFSAKFVGVM